MSKHKSDKSTAKSQLLMIYEALKLQTKEEFDLWLARDRLYYNVKFYIGFGSFDFSSVAMIMFLFMIKFLKK